MQRGDEEGVRPGLCAPAARQLTEVPRPNGHGQVFLGWWTVPKAACSTVLEAGAAEGPTAGRGRRP